MEASAFGIDKLSTCKTVAVKMLKGRFSKTAKANIVSPTKLYVDISIRFLLLNVNYFFPHGL